MTTTELLLPNPVSLSDAQQRGAACVWCAASLTITAAHDLGPRQIVPGSSVHWFPRCCPSCRKDRA
ncbi:hypothetical protein DNK56_23230 [Streptomyces sp. AC1-42W]|nr:hypothetical protein DNK56_23230 [Streptomyces sp. AC1-42W]PZT79777.1 hypothetical protein DNK55_09455 [Streptomyces sp. AC1-42T]